MIRCEICNKDFNSEKALEMHNGHKHPEKIKKKLTLSQKKKIRTYSIALISIFILIILIYWKVVPPENAPLISVNSNSIDFGDVSQAKGTTSKILEITNEGKSDLIINNMDTSCGCTSATFIYQGKESPHFTMANHGTNPRNFNLVIPPNDKVQLKIYYDPNVHRSMRGAVTRSVYIYSNDPQHKKKEVRIHVNQVN